MVRIAVAGAAGRMGSRIVALSRDYESIELAGAFERAGHKDIGKDVGIIAGIGETHILLRDNIEKVLDEADAVVDFTYTESTLEHLKAASAKGRAMVIGTTGFSKEEMESIRKTSGSIPVVLAPNMSVGVNLLLKVLGDVARVLGDDYDIEIVEARSEE